MLMGIAIYGEYFMGDWIFETKIIKKSIKPYAHFDMRTNLNKVRDYIKDVDKIATNSFYPFIHYEMRMEKYNKKKGHTIKSRDIYYAAHKDRCIFQYYAHLINEKYNEYVIHNGLNKVSVAYRDNLHESNIDSSKRAFDFIKSKGDSYVLIGDFKSFFDGLDHRYLKEQLMKVLGVDRLSEDYYAVFKNVTRFSFVELNDLLRLNGLKQTKKDIKKLNKQRQVLTKEEFRNNKSIVKKNISGRGIPQGSPISAVLANVYMASADKMLNDYIKMNNGFYMRYSDDFIVVIPNTEDYKAMINHILSIIKDVPNLILENKKTQIFSVKNNVVTNIGETIIKDADSSNNEINFLGFTYDGLKIRLRAKTVGKYYYRMYRKAKVVAAKGGMGTGKLYRRYSERGSFGKEGNFFTYVRNVEKVYGEDEQIRRDLRGNLGKIKRAIKGKI